MRLFAPRSQQENERLITRVQNSFGAGAFDDIPATMIPRNGVKYSKNYLLFPDRAECRGGTKRWSAVTLPHYSTFTGISASKSGRTITKTVGTDFDDSLIGFYFVHDDGKHDLITDVPSLTTLTVESSEAHPASTAGWIRGPSETWYHIGTSYIILHIDNRLFYADVNITSWKEITRMGNLSLSKEKSIFVEFKNDAYIFNDNGIFKLILTTSFPHYYKINTQVPRDRIVNITKSDTLVYGYKYLYCMSKIAGSAYNRTRATNNLENMSGPCEPDPTNYIDYGLVYAASPIGDGGTTYATLKSGVLPPAYDTIAEWAAISNGQAKFTINGTTINIVVDFTGVESWAEICERIQIALRDYWPRVLFTWTSTNRFLLTNPEEGGTVDYVTAGEGGTDIGSSALAMQNLVGEKTTPKFTNALTVGNLRIPKYYMTEDPYFISHWTHYSIYRTLDIGINGVDPITGKANSPELFIWVADVPVAKAFKAVVVSNTVTADKDVFTIEDVGSVIRFAGGTRATITEYINSRNVKAIHADVTKQAACIGGGYPMTINQVGTRVTSSSSLHYFAPHNIGEPIFLEDGSFVVIKSIISRTECEVAPSRNYSDFAATFEPCANSIDVRKFNDTIRDFYYGTDTTVKQLASRIAGFSLPNRFWTNLPSDCNCGTISNGFMIATQRNNKEVFYGMIPNNMEYLAGYYNEYNQVVTFKDAITHISNFMNIAVVYCKNSIYALPLTNYLSKKIEQVGEVVAIIQGQYVISEHLGVKDWGSIVKIGSNIDQFITDEPAIRQLTYSDRFELSANLAKDRIVKRLRKCNGRFATNYDPINGYIWWSKELAEAEKIIGIETLQDQFSSINIYQDSFDGEEVIQDTF